jgi:tetratricopeptide (TPR) repeat protein
MPSLISMNPYTRQDVLRILHLQSRQLSAWERAGLIPSFPGKEKVYSFEHLSQLRALREMRGKRISIGSIRRSVEAMQKVSGMRNVLTETSAVRHGAGLVFRHAGALVNPMTRQTAFDFETVDRQGKIVNAGFERARRVETTPATGPVSAPVQEMFLRGVQLEENASTIPDAARMYEAILEMKPDHAPACINLGTIFYNQQEFGRAEEMYRRATEADPEYALAFFDLGNVLDEMQRLDEAIEAYSRAIAIVPQYADAHYNLALAYERQGERRRALRHWTTYVRLDPVGPWAAHAKVQTRKILSMERLSIVSRGGRGVAAAG